MGFDFTHLLHQNFAYYMNHVENHKLKGRVAISIEL